MINPATTRTRLRAGLVAKKPVIESEGETPNAMAERQKKRLSLKSKQAVQVDTYKAAVDDNISNEEQIWIAQVLADWNHLKTIKDHAERNTYKPAMLDKYRGYLSDLIQAGEATQNETLVPNLIWALDSKQWDWAVDLADYCYTAKQESILIKRDPATFTADTIRGALREARNQSKADGAAPVSLELLKAFGDIFERVHGEIWQVAHVTQAKTYRMAGFIAGDDNDTLKEAEYLTKANALYPGVNVKTKMEAAQKKAQTMIDAEATGNKPIAEQQG